MFWDLGLRARGSGCVVTGLRSRVWGVDFGFKGLGFEVWGSGFRVQDLKFRVQG
jgi:hypothetical protein